MESQLEMIQQWEVAVKDFRKLLVWEKAHQLTLAIYQVTAVFPSAETYGLTSQMRRAASSIPSNIAEGCGRDGDAGTVSLLHDRPRLPRANWNTKSSCPEI